MESVVIKLPAHQKWGAGAEAEQRPEGHPGPRAEVRAPSHPLVPFAMRGWEK